MALFIILVSLMMTFFSAKVLISNRCISGLMSKLIEKSWTDSNVGMYVTWYLTTGMSEVGLGQRWEGVCPSRFCPRPYFSLLQIFGPHVTDFKTLWHPIARLWNLFESGSKLVDFLVLKKGTFCIL